MLLSLFVHLNRDLQWATVNYLEIQIISDLVRSGGNSNFTSLFLSFIIIYLITETSYLLAFISHLSPKTELCFYKHDYLCSICLLGALYFSSS